MALEVLVAGRYAGAYNLIDVGITELGYDVTLETRWEEISETDAFGLSLIDGIFRGGMCTIQFDSRAYKAGSVAPFWPWGGNRAAGVLGTLINPVAVAPLSPIGSLVSDVAKSFVLTSTAGTPAAASPATLSATKAILAPNFPGRLLFNSKLRNVPVRLMFLPDNIGSGIIAFFATT